MTDYGIGHIWAQPDTEVRAAVAQQIPSRDQRNSTPK